MSSDATDVTYHLDAGLTLTAVDGAWSAFATENGAPDLLPPAPIGKPIQAFIADLTTAQIYEDVFAAVRRRGGISFPIRCDSPSLRRQLRIGVHASNDGFLIRSTVVRVQARRSVRLLDLAVARSDDLVRSCGWCKRIDVRGHWHEVEVAIERLSLFEAERMPMLTHGMCESCMESMEGLIRTAEGR